MTAPTLEVLALQAQQIRQQICALRMQLIHHGSPLASGHDMWSHLHSAIAYCWSASESLVQVRACADAARIAAQVPVLTDEDRRQAEQSSPEIVLGTIRNPRAKGNKEAKP